MFIELLFNGIVQGSLLALICIGYSLVYGSAKVLNFAHADVMIAAGGYLVLFLLQGIMVSPACAAGMPLLFGVSAGVSADLLLVRNKPPALRKAAAAGIALLLAGAVYLLQGRLPFAMALLLAIPCAGALATAIYRVGYLPLLQKTAPRNSILLASFGLSIALESLLLVLWGSQRRVLPAAALPRALTVRAADSGDGFWASVTGSGIVPVLPDFAFPVRDVAIIVVFAALAIGLALFFHHARAGDAIVAIGDNQRAAMACGIPVYAVLGQTFFVAGAIAAISGAFYVLRTTGLNPTAGFAPGILAFVACVVGGIGSLRGSVAGAMLIGIVTSMAPGVPLGEWVAASVPTGWLAFLPSLKPSDWSYGVVYALMIVTVVFKPRGLFAR